MTKLFETVSINLEQAAALISLGRAQASAAIWGEPDVMVSDIREGPDEEYWDRLRDMMGPNGLLTYWYLGRAFNQHEDPTTMRLRRDMRNRAGGIMAAPLAIAAPETGGWRDRHVVSAPVAYGLHIIDDARDVNE